MNNWEQKIGFIRLLVCVCFKKWEKVTETYFVLLEPKKKNEIMFELFFYRNDVFVESSFFFERMSSDYLIHTILRCKIGLFYYVRVVVLYHGNFLNEKCLMMGNFSHEILHHWPMPLENFHIRNYSSCDFKRISSRKIFYKLDFKCFTLIFYINGWFRVVAKILLCIFWMCCDTWKKEEIIIEREFRN